MKRIATGALVALLVAAMLPATVLAGLSNDLAFSLTGLTATFGDTAVDITSFATPGGSTSPVTFDSNSTGICTTGGTNGELVTIVHAGTCSITASQAGDGTYDPAAPVTDTFLIGKATPACVITGYTATFNGSAHTAGGSCLGVGSVVLLGLNKSATTHTNAGTYTNNAWTFTDGTGNYNNDSGTVDSTINKANPDCSSVIGYAATYTGSPHTATGNCIAVDGTTHLAGLDLSGTSHTIVGTFNGDPWTFTDGTGNYNDDSGTVNDSIGKASAVCTSIVGYTTTYNGSPHTATGHCLGVDGTTQLAGVSLVGTTHTNAGTYNNDPWSFTDVTGLYTSTSGTVNDVISKAGQTLVFDVTAAGKTFGDVAFALGAFTSPGASTGAVSYVSETTPVCTVSGVTLTIHKAGLCTIKASQAGDANHNAAADVTSGFTVAKANADCSSITGYTATYDTFAHTATGACFALGGTTELAGLDLTGTTHTGAGTYNGDAWTFTDVTGNYNDTNGTVNDSIGKAAASCSITGYAVTFDGAPHTATGSCTGIAAVPLADPDLSGTTHTNAGNHSDPWAFTDVSGNYLNQNGLVSDSITKANADCTSVTAYAATYDGSPHLATGNCVALDGLTTLAGLDRSGTSHTNAGTYANDPWTFTDVTGNYHDTSGTVDDSIAKAPQTIDFTSTPPATVNIGDTYNLTATATDGGTVTFSIDPPKALICSLATPTQVHFDARGACVVVGSEPGDSNYLAGTGQQSIPVSDIPPTCTADATVHPVIMNVPATGTIVTGPGSSSCQDAEHDYPLTYGVETQGAHGTVTFTGSKWTYTPAANVDNVDDSFTFRAQDSLSAFSLPSTVTIHIAVNLPALAKTDAVTVPAVTPKSINVLANDLAGSVSGSTKDQELGQPLTITKVASATKHPLGTVTTNGHTIVYDPNGCSYGSDLLTYTVTDGLTTSTAYVAVTVAKPGQAGISKTPLTNPPAASFILGSKTSATVPVHVAWCGLTQTSTRTFRVLQSSNGGHSFPSTLYASTKLTSTTRSLVVGANYAWRVRTIDGSRRVSAYATSLTSTVQRFQNTSPWIVYSAGWGLSKSANYSGGSEQYSSSATATATLALPADTRAFAVVSSKASNHGSFKIFVDGALVATVSQKVSKTAYQIVGYVRGVTSSAPHTIVFAPVGNGRIDLDAILTLQ